MIPTRVSVYESGHGYTWWDVSRPKDVPEMFKVVVVPRTDQSGPAYRYAETMDRAARAVQDAMILEQQGGGG